ncbi:hypothetical protein T235_09495 [Tannerella sp. oral taxon BU063 isolate Cell 8/11]|uniref:DUF805 domain-containing protein n=1 Tax=Tannerella sp. oral taxon BU063 isolate Cell 8/11 TaxID=1411915 RepID=W2CZC6_9BACT|nr:hypothetical protein T235_09495 [Tannerella sp. oral taxon BU063 isolate Cell 8/11]
MEDATKRCPYCGEEILAVAKKCKHCGEWLDENAQVSEPQLTSVPEPVCEPTPEPKKDPVDEREEATSTAEPVRRPGFFEYYFIDLFIRRYADFKGKTSRQQFWMGGLCFVLLLLTLFCIDLATGLMFVCTLVGTLALTVPFVAAAIRRLHDTGRSGWWFLIQYVPVVGPIWLLVLLCQKGETRDDQRPAFQLPTDAIAAAAMVLIVGVSIIWVSIGSNEYKRTKRAVYEEAYRSMAEAANAEKEANDDPNAIPDEVVDVANACSYYDNDRSLTANDFTLIARYNDAGRHCAYYTQKEYQVVLYQYNLENRKVRVIDLNKTAITPKKEGQMEISPVIFEVSQIVVKGDNFYIVGSTNANAGGYVAYLVSYDTGYESFECLDYGIDIRLINNNRQAVVTHAKMIKEAECYADCEFKTWDVTVNLP